MIVRCMHSWIDEEMAEIMNPGLVDLEGLIWGSGRRRLGVRAVSGFRVQGKWKWGRAHSLSEVSCGC